MTALSDAALKAPAPPLTRSWPRRLLRGRRDDPAWARPGLFVLLAATTVLYLWRLADSGWANAFYSAAAQAGSKSWEAFFYGSSDASNFITVDKTPAALWVMDLSSGNAERIMTGNTYGASWSPDGAWVATTVRNELEDGQHRTDLWVTCVKGCDPIKVYEGGVNGPTWGPPQ